MCMKVSCPDPGQLFFTPLGVVFLTIAVNLSIYRVVLEQTIIIYSN